MRVDVHSHIIRPELNGKAGKYGPDFRIENGYVSLRIGDNVGLIKLDPKVLEEHGENADPSVYLSTGVWADTSGRLAEMDAKGIDVMGITISPLCYLYWAEPEIGIPFAKIQNDTLADYCRPAYGRLFFMATLPLQDIDESVKEVDRAVGELGARGINIGGANLAGREVDDEALFPVYERIEALGVPIFLHPYPAHRG